MHPESYREMERILNGWQGNASVLDVGSTDVNGSYRPMVEERGWEYLGLDLAPGKNVDVVADDPYAYPFPDGAFDIVLSGSTAEHVAMPWLWFPELARLVRPGGLLGVISHVCWPEHRYPIDTFRYMPDGFRVLFDLTGALRDYDIRITNDGKDICGTAWKAER